MQRESNLFIMSMITDRIGRNKVLLPINHKNYNFQEKKNSQVMWQREILPLKKWQRMHKFRTLYTVSIVIETKVVIGWFKLQQLL